MVLGKMGTLSLVLCGLFCIFCFFIYPSTSELQVEVTAPWRSSPVLERAAFYAATRDLGGRDRFWGFVADRNRTEDADKLLKVSLEAGEFVGQVEAQTRLAENLRKALGFEVACGNDAWAAVEVEGKGGVFATCNVKDLIAGVPSSETCSALETSALELLPTDYIHPSSSNDGRIIIIHGDIVSSGFFQLWEGALQLLKANGKGIRLVLRFQQLRTDTQPKFGGFSVSLDIKNTEYVAVDRSLKKDEQHQDGMSEDLSLESGIYFSRMTERFQGDAEKLTKLNTLKSTLKINREKLKAWEVGDVSIQAVLDILGAQNPLEQLKLISENLPSHARRLAKIPVPDETRGLVKERSQLSTAVWLNGFPLSLHDDFSQTLNQLREDVWFARQASSAGISKGTFRKWTSADKPESSKSGRSGWGARVDVRKFAKGAVQFLNDIEKDAAYNGMSKSLNPLRTASAAAAMQLIPIRRNLYTCILMLDPSDASQMEPLSVVRYFLRVGAPIRFGLVLTSNELAKTYSKGDSKDLPLENITPCSDDQEKGLRCTSTTCLVRLYAATRKDYGADVALAFLVDVVPQVVESSSTCAKVVQLFAETLAQETGSWTSGKFVKLAETALAGVETKHGDAQQGVEATVRKMARYVGALGFAVPSLTFNGQIHDLGKSRLDRIVQPMLFQEQNLLRQHADSLVDEEDVLSQILRLSQATSRNSRLVNVPDSQMQFLTPDALVAKREQLKSLRYVTAAGRATNPSVRTVTFWVPLVSERKKSSCVVAREALKVVKDYSSNEQVAIRVSFIPKQGMDPSKWMEMMSLVDKQDVGQLDEFFSSADTCQQLFHEGTAEVKDVEFEIAQLVPREALVVCNGRVIVSSNQDEDDDDSSVFNSQDMALLVENELGRVSAVVDEEQQTDPDRLLLITSLLGIHARMAASRSESIADSTAIHPPAISLNDDLTVVDDGFFRDDDWNRPQIVLTIDPMSLNTPKASAMALWLKNDFNAMVAIVFHPRPDIAQLPPSSFHRWTPSRTAVFDSQSIPLDQLLTLKVATPQSWIVYPGDMKSRDPDNLLMSEGPLKAVYEIAHVIIDGHAIDVDKGGEPAAGMQLELLEFNGLASSTKEKEPETTKLTDSIVMYNLGYWQMKAKPGTWRLRSIKRNLVFSSSSSSQRQRERLVSFKDFSGPGAIELKVQASSADGTEQEESSSAGVTAKWTKDDAENGVMHVFSLASGALYERFLRIMMLSVRKRSSGRIKFWLLENYMSAQMKRFLPSFAEKNGFEYELVTFKWPDWLRGQSERQRQIWGMKILFLDVLFPLNVKRIIYVDSDQVLRADLRELWRMDLQGAPYAMTPFCDSRKETLGFQFWRQGYWSTHLRGKPYHISALFVVDLVTFREQSVGDRLRAVYQQLSADPNSLSNLDQDLPNFAQHDIPIFSLPQEWLWCESWCSDDSKRKAKTIDLCNNPLHKEPKLEMAKRVIRGELFKESWEDLDHEVGWSTQE